MNALLNPIGSALLVSHNGLGDNLFMVGATNYLLEFYQYVFLLCKHKYYPNVIEFFPQTLNQRIFVIPFNENHEAEQLLYIANHNRSTKDILICGCHKDYIKSSITNTKYLASVTGETKQKYEIVKNMNLDGYDFIENFYTDIGLNLNHFVDYFKLPETEESIKLYNSIKQYKIIFTQIKSSTGHILNIDEYIEKYKDNDEYIIICNDKNIYGKKEKKYNLAEKFVMNKIVNYYTTILNSYKIKIIDSCFTGIVLPLHLGNKLKTKDVKIIKRDTC
tara:strand:- start:50 stop:877 length:828 start_codon:yes stop_codon:yes gene_type:complete